MGPIERDAQMDGPRGLRHKHSASSDHGRALVIPMWDSSDPERAPPPLPLNPQSPSVGTSRPGTSSAIQSAHAALTEKARESNSSPYAGKRLSEVPPLERPLPRPSPHRRMQSLQPGNIRDRGFMIEGIPSSPLSPEKSTRPTTPVKQRDSVSFSSDKDSPSRALPLAPGPSLTPIVRPTAVRRTHQSILGENTPPQSATMLALQNMSTPAAKEVDPPVFGPSSPSVPAATQALSNVTNGSTAITKAPQSLDAATLSHQIVTLTNIATSLQKEMSALSRRSRDNATDLMSLKQATNSRDEDIRKTLRDLMGNVSDGSRASSRDPFLSGLMIDSKPHPTSPPSSSRAARPFSLPRIPSPTSFAASIDRDDVSTSAASATGSSSGTPATIALLEKIIRDMGTREGQDLLVARLSEVADKLAGMASATKVEDLLKILKESEQNMIAGKSSGGNGGKLGPRTVSFDEEHREPCQTRKIALDGARTGNASPSLEVRTRTKDGREISSTAKSSANDIVGEDVLKIIRSVKDSVSQGGGLTAEVKALVRELRGEVLGMGRELRRRLDEVAADGDGSAEQAAQSEEMKRIVSDGLSELKSHMDSLLREHRRQSAMSASSRASLIDYQEIYNAMRSALKDTQATKVPQQEPPTREDVISAVREAWENYKPEIEVQQFGLERDEILACLKEGFQSHAPPEDQPVPATREEVFRAVVEGLKHFVPPPVETPATLSRDEVLDAVRECLEEFEFPIAPSAMGNDLSKDDMVQAVKEGLNGFEFPQSQALTVAQPGNDMIMSRLGEIVEFIRLEFRAVSDEARENVAANGRDTEQVLDATKDGFEKLRLDMQAYADRVSRSSTQNDSAEDVVRALDGFRDQISQLLQSQIDSLRDSVNMSLVPAAPAAQNPSKEALEAIKDGVDRIRGELQRPLAGTTEILDAIHDGVSDLHTSIDKLANRPADLTANDEILEALKAGLDSVRSDIEGIRESRDDRAVAIAENAIVPAEPPKEDELKNLEVMISQLGVKLEAMAKEPAPDSVSKDDLTRIEDMLKTIKEAVEGLQNTAPPEEKAAPTPDEGLREDVQAIETILRNTKARLDDLIDGEKAVRKEHVDGLESLILETRETLSSIATQMESTSRREDITSLESLISHVAAAYDEMKERADKELENPERVTRTDIEAVEAVCVDIKALVDGISKTDLAILPTKEEVSTMVEDVKNRVEALTDANAVLPTKDELSTMIEDLKDRVEALTDANARAMEERQAETVGVSDRVSEVKEFLMEFQDMTKSRLQDGVVGVETLGKLLEKMGDTISNNATVGDDLREMFEAMKVEFEESRAGVVGAKLDADDKFQQTTDTLSSKIDERVDDLVAKYDEFQAAMEERAKAGEARDEEIEAAVVGTKAVADELKLLIDTLGLTVTESLEKMEEASRTVFNRVEDLVTRTDDNHTEDKAEHEQTRDRIKQAIEAVENLQGPVSEFQPKILETAKDILLIVGQHYDYAKTATTDIHQKIEDAKPPPAPPALPPVEQYDDAAMQEKLDKLDSSLQEKLDKLVDHTHAAGKAYAQLDTLDKIHQQVLATASGISLFLESQTQRIADEHEDREKTLQETTLALERRSAEKEAVEANIARLREEEERLKQSAEETLARLRDEEDRLRQNAEESLARLREEEERMRDSVFGLKAEQEILTRQKTRLTADLSSLETALRLRKDELGEMEERAEGLERRILEGVMNHSRVLLMSKAAAGSGSDAMSRKRVRVKNDAVGGGSKRSSTAGEPPLKPAVSMALSAKRNMQSNPAGASRRIVSLSQITHNVPTGGVKRSHSVKTPAGGVGRRGGLRKSSWGGSNAKKYGDLDKENVVDLKESNEEDEQPEPEVGRELVVRGTGYDPTESLVSLGTTLDGEGEEDDDDGDDDDGEEVSEAETLRRSSRGTTIISSSSVTGTEDSDGESYDDDSEYDSRSDWTESAVGSTLSETTVAGNEIVLLQP